VHADQPSEADRDQRSCCRLVADMTAPGDHLAFFVLDECPTRLGSFYAEYREDGRGGAAYDPASYSLCSSMPTASERSSRRIERRSSRTSPSGSWVRTSPRPRTKIEANARRGQPHRRSSPTRSSPRQNARTQRRRTLRESRGDELRRTGRGVRTGGQSCEALPSARRERCR